MPEMMASLETLRKELPTKPAVAPLDLPQSQPVGVWMDAAAAPLVALPAFYDRCFSQEWKRREPVLSAAAQRWQETLEGLDVFGHMERFTGCSFHELAASLRPSEFVRPSCFSVSRAGRMAIVGQRQAAFKAYADHIVQEGIVSRRIVDHLL